MAGEGFEPSKAEPGDLQSPPIGRSGNPPGSYIYGGRKITSNHFKEVIQRFLARERQKTKQRLKIATANIEIVTGELKTPGFVFSS